MSKVYYNAEYNVLMVITPSGHGFNHHETDFSFRYFDINALNQFYENLVELGDL
jgi:hypothetical protein